MATEGGVQTPDLSPDSNQSQQTDPRFAAVREMLEKEPYSVRFFQAVRLMERLYPDRKPVGLFVAPTSEVVQFSSLPSLAFPASEIQNFSRARTDVRSCPSTLWD